jgi:3-oxoacyl-ACP reductase-like protein
MSIFGKIKDAIFGKKKEAPPAAAPAQAPAGAPTATAAPATPPAPVAISEVDVEEILNDAAAEKGQKLNWRTSIVDLMKLLDIDSSLDNRQELAKELGYTGELNGSAEMNIWLHRAVMRELAKNGGKVPADLAD